MATAIISFRWLDLLEKEFDKNFVDLNLIIDEVEDAEENEWTHVAKAKIEALSSCFAQLTHKAQTIFQNNAKYEAELVNLRHELTQSQATCGVLKDESHDMLMRLHAAHLELYTKGSPSDATSSQTVGQIRKRLEKELEDERTTRLQNAAPKHEAALLHKENDALRKEIVALQSELCGAKLASKYLDKELAGRIQQLQLLSHGDIKGDQHEKLWRQLEAEIHLHRHKTIVRAFRHRSFINHSDDISQNYSSVNHKAHRQKAPLHRYITVTCPPGQDFGLSITGGIDYGIPIMISYIHPNSAAKSSGQFYIGDAILSVNGHSLKEVSHADAIRLLSSQKGKMTLEVLFIPPEENEFEDDDVIIGDENFALKYKMFDEEVSSIASSSAFIQNGRLSRASIDSIRGSTDDIIGSPRKYAECNLEFPIGVNGIPYTEGNPDEVNGIPDSGCNPDNLPDSIFQDAQTNDDQEENAHVIPEDIQENHPHSSPDTISNLNSELPQESLPNIPQSTLADHSHSVDGGNCDHDGNNGENCGHVGGNGENIEDLSHQTPLEEVQIMTLENDKQLLKMDSSGSITEKTQNAISANTKDTKSNQVLFNGSY